MLKLTSLAFHYPDTEFRLHVPELQVARGGKVAVIGPSGSGKTTLMNLVSGILVPDEGLVKVNDVAVNELSDTKRRAFRISQIGFVFQDFKLLDYLSVIDNILHPYRITRALRLNREVRERAKTLAERMGIDSTVISGPVMSTLVDATGLLIYFSIAQVVMGI